MEEQRTSSKNSRASSQKKSGQSGSNGSHKDSAGSAEEVIKLNKKVQEAQSINKNTEQLIEEDKK